MDDVPDDRRLAPHARDVERTRSELPAEVNIDAIEVRTYRLPLDPAFHASWDPHPRTSLTSTIVRISSGDFEGVGSGDAMPGFAGHEDLFLGRDVFDIERHVRVLDNLQFHYGRMWPIEIAVWDLAGKIKGEPLWRMLGGTSPRVRLYASTGQRLEVDARVESARRLRHAGFPAIKLRFWHDRPEDDIAIVRAVRQAVGSEVQLLTDANQAWRMPWDTSPSWDLETAARVAEELADLGAFWLEEPLHRHAYDDLAALSKRSRVRIAGGEGNRDYGDFVHYLAHGSLDVYQPDVAWSTGILRATQLAARVRDAGALYSPHTWGDGLVLLANLHVAAAVSNAPFIEFAYDPPYWTPDRRDFMLPHPMEADAEGYVTLPDTPGLGIRVDWKALENLSV